MTVFKWREGFPKPKGVHVEDVAAVLNEMPDPSPEALYEASKAEDHILHNAVWGEGDQLWAVRGRLSYCRHIISAVQEVTVVGGRQIDTRVVETVTVNKERKWARMDDIVADEAMAEAYMDSIKMLQEQALAKMERFQAFVQARKQQTG